MTTKLNRPMKRRLFAAFLSFCALLTAALGIWQIERRSWKLALIDAVDRRVTAPATPAPAPPAWPAIDAQRDSYRHVEVRGQFLNEKSTLVRAVSGLGEGYWLMTPLRTEQGWILLINRGFVPDGRDDPRARLHKPQGLQTVSGLLRLTEPGGAVLRPNDPPSDRWYSRDVAAIAERRGLGTIAPYFVDAGAGPESPGDPVAGLTVVHFRNAHLSYALTWFALSALSLLMLARLLRMRDDERHGDSSVRRP